jgi:hypothetical protein
MKTYAYEKPVVADHGDLVALTAATGYRGPEDGMIKDPLEVVPHHSGPLT